MDRLSRLTTLQETKTLDCWTPKAKGVDPRFVCLFVLVLAGSPAPHQCSSYSCLFVCLFSYPKLRHRYHRQLDKSIQLMVTGQCVEMHVPIVPPNPFKTFKHYNFQLPKDLEPIRNTFMDTKVYTQRKCMFLTFTKYFQLTNLQNTDILQG